MALVFLFALASVGLMLVSAVHGSLTFGVALALACFSLLASGVFVGLFRMAKHWEDEPST
jgi:hypothetical protein